VRFARSSTALTGSELGNSYETNIDSSLHRWRNYPYPESTEIDIFTDIDGNKDSSDIKGTVKSLNLTLGLGYETRLNKKLNGFIGVKSILGLASDTSSKLGIKITTIDTLTDTTGISGSQLIKSKSFSIALPLGLEYKLLPSLTVRAGFTPKFSYNKSGLTTHNQIEIANGALYYSFGIGYIFQDKFSIDTYNYGNLGSLNNWNIQFKYMF
jgi:opacity protein-like surface antigen